MTTTQQAISQLYNILEYLNTSYLTGLSSPYAGNGVTTYMGSRSGELLSLLLSDYDLSKYVKPSVNDIYYLVKGNTTVQSGSIDNIISTNNVSLIISNSLVLKDPFEATPNASVYVYGSNNYGFPKILQSLYITHAVLDSTNFKTLTTTGSLQVTILPTTAESMANENYTLTYDTNSGSLTVVPNPNPNPTSININIEIFGFTIKDLVTNNIPVYVLRRIFYMYITLFHFKFANQFSKASVSVGNSICRQIYSIINNLNNDISGNGVYQQVITALTQNQGEYSQRQNDIKNVNNIIQNNNIQNKKQIEVSNSRSITNKQANVFTIIATIFLLIITLFACGLVLYPADKNIKLILAAILFVSAITMGIVLYISYIKTVGIENFGLQENFALADTVPEYNSMIAISTNIKLSMFQSLVTFLQNTDRIQNSLIAYKGFEDVNEVLDNELNFYNSVYFTQDNNAKKISNSSNLTLLSSKERKNRMYLMISLSIVITLTTLLYVATDSNPSLQMKILIIGGILAGLVFSFYVMATNAFVHTNGTKVYWNKPKVPGVS